MALLVDAYTSTYRDAYAASPVALADTYGDGTYRDTYGTPLAAPGAQAALQLTGGTWADITGRMIPPGLAGPALAISRGRPDETSQAAPSVMTATLDNRDGRLSYRNPLGAWYGQFGRNSPVRVSVPALEPFLRMETDQVSGASCPDAPPLGITGGIGIRIDVNLTDYRPCVLASKWAATTGSVTLGGTTVGATCNQACYPAATSQISAAHIMDGIAGRPVAETSQKVFFETGTTTTFPSSVLAKDKGLLDARVLLWLCYKPLPDGSQLSQLTTSISAYLAYAAAAGAPVPKVVLWQEPQNSSNIALGLPNAAAYKTCMRNHYAAIKALAGSPAVVYCSASHLGETGVSAWYPGDAYCDELAQDLYGYTWKHGTTLATLASIANAASPQKPVSQAEAGTALSQAQANTMSHQDVANYFAYSTNFFAARSAAGLPNGEWMWFNGLGGANWNTIQPGDFRIPLMDALYDALQPSSSGGVTSARSWALVLNGNGTVSFWWTTDGTYATLHTVTSTAPIPLGRVCIRVHGQAAAPAGVTFYTAPGGNAGNTGDTAPWSQLGATVSVASLSIFAAAVPLQVGYNAAVTADNSAYGGPAGQVFQFQLRSFAGTYQDTYTDLYGVAAGGNVVADAAFCAQNPGVTGFTDAYGNLWQATGTAEITGSDYRFHGELAALQLTWDPTVTNIRAPVRAAGLLRRLSQGQQPPVSSAFKRAVLSRTGALAPVAYWPGEDAAGATQIGPAIGPAAMTGSQLPSLAGDSGFACSLPLPTYGFSSVTGAVQPYTGATAAVVRFLMHVPASNTIADDSIICRFNTTGSAGDVTLKWKTGGQLRFHGYGSAGGGGFLWDTGASGAFAVNGELALVSIELTQSGSKLAWQLAVLQVGQNTPATVSGTVSSASPGNVTAVHLGLNSTSLSGTGLGHVFAQAAYEPVANFASALAAYAGETCANRFARLCSDNGIAARIYGYPASDVPMGAQQPGTLPALLQACEDTGRGQMFEPRQALALGYRTVRSLCQQAPAVTLDTSKGHLDVLAPVDDDQRTVNDVTVSSGTGASFRAVLADGSAMSVSPPPQGAGEYGNSYTAAPASDSQLAGIAGWILHTGTVNEERYPSVTADLMGAELAGYIPALQALDIGGHVAITGTPALFLPPGDIRQLAYGTTEELGTRLWRMTFNTVPESPYETGIYADPVFGRMDTDGSQLDADIGTGSTVFLVDLTGPSALPWTTAAAQFPFDVLMGGEQMTVTGITGPPVNFLTGDNTGFEATLGNWAAVTNCGMSQSSAAAHTGNGALQVISTLASPMTTASCPAGNILTQGMPCAAGDTVSVSAWLRAATNAESCQVGADFYDSGGVFLSTALGPGTFDKVHSWTQIAAAVTAPASAAFARVSVTIAAGSAAEIHYVDDVFLGDITAGGTPQQQFTVIRSVNGIVKAHSAGEPVSLAHPAIIGLA